MVALYITRPGASSPETLHLDDGRFLAGRGEACRIRLEYPDVSERHAMIAVSGGNVRIEDLNSSNGTYVNGEPLFGGAAALAPDTLVQIGGCLLRAAPAEGIPGGEPQTCAEAFDNGRDVRPEEECDGSAPAQEAPEDPLAEMRRQVREQIHRELISRLDLKRLTAGGIDREGLERRAREQLHEIVEEVRGNGRLPPALDPDGIEAEVYDEAMRLGPLEQLLADDSVTEIMVNGPERIYVERRGKLELTPYRFTDAGSVMSVIERIVSPIGRRIDESQPYVDARLADGSRVNAVIPPLSLSGPVITIRKFSRRTFRAEDFVRFGTWTRNAAEFMRAAVMLRKNVVVSGGTGSGKTTLLNLLSGFIPRSERIVTIEDAAELRLDQPHVIRMEARPPNIEGRGAVTIRDLVRNSLRMRPDRIIVGECRGGEALDMLQAMNTGHDGSLTTVHANSPRDVVSRLETMVLMGGVELPSRAIREQIAGAVDVIIHESRMSDGTRKIASISEVSGMEGQQIVMQEIFAFRQTGIGPGGKVLGSFGPTGNVPAFHEAFAANGMILDPAIYDPDCDRDVRLRFASGGEDAP